MDSTAQLARLIQGTGAALLPASCATKPEIASDYDRSANFAGGPFWGRSIDVRQYRPGTLAIDVFDQHAHRPVWHGSAQKELTRKDLEQPAEPISEAVNSVLAKFPPA